MPCTTAFNPDHPPLLSECGFGKIALLQSSDVGEQVQTGLEVDPIAVMSFKVASVKVRVDGVDLQVGTSIEQGAIHPGATATPKMSVTVRIRRFWRQYKPTMHLESDVTIVDSLSFSSSVQQLRNMRAAISATAGVGAGPFTAEVSAELETAVQLQTDTESLSAQEKKVELKGGMTYAFWELVSEIDMRLDKDWNGELKFGGHVVVNGQDRPFDVSTTMFQPSGTVVGPGDVFAVAGATFQDAVKTSTLMP